MKPEAPLPSCCSLKLQAEGLLTLRDPSLCGAKPPAMNQRVESQSIALAPLPGPVTEVEALMVSVCAAQGHWAPAGWRCLRGAAAWGHSAPRSLSAGASLIASRGRGGSFPRRLPWHPLVHTSGLVAPCTPRGTRPLGGHRATWLCAQPRGHQRPWLCWNGVAEANGREDGDSESRVCHGREGPSRRPGTLSRSRNPALPSDETPDGPGRAHGEGWTPRRGALQPDTRVPCGKGFVLGRVHQGFNQI